MSHTSLAVALLLYFFIIRQAPLAGVALRNGEANETVLFTGEVHAYAYCQSILNRDSGNNIQTWNKRGEVCILKVLESIHVRNKRRMVVRFSETGKLVINEAFPGEGIPMFQHGANKGVYLSATDMAFYNTVMPMYIEFNNEDIRDDFVANFAG